MARLNELRLVSRVAHMYYIEGHKQSTIAEHFHLSQTTVSRMLKRATTEGIVRTTVVPPTGTYTELETAIRETFGISEAIVVECSEDRDLPIMSRIGEAAAHFIETTMQPNEIIGVSSWSETILKMVENLHPMKSDHAKYVVQTLGGMGNPSVQTHATQLTSRLANLTGAEARLLTTPGVATSPEARSVLLSDSYAKSTVELFDQITLAVVGIGAIEPSGMLSRSGNVFSSEELAQISDSGGIGDIGLRFFNLDGESIKTSLDERVIGITLEQLKAVDRVIAVAGGSEKPSAIHGALKTGSIDVLITDKFTAEKIIRG